MHATTTIQRIRSSFGSKFFGFEGKATTRRFIMAIVCVTHHTSVEWMQEGEHVQVRGLSRQYKQYETLPWKIAARPEPDGKIVLQSLGEAAKTIRVSVHKVSPTTLTLASPQAQASWSPNLQIDAPFHLEA